MHTLTAHTHTQTDTHTHTRIHSQPQRDGTALAVSGRGGGLNCVPPASVTWDIFYMIEPNAWDWTHMTTFRQLGGIGVCIFCKTRLHYLYLCIFLMHFAPIRYSKQTDNWQIGIEVLMRKRQTEAEMKHGLPIQIAVITLSTSKLCNNLYSIALLRWGGKK